MSAVKPPLSQTHPFTCNTCQVAFRSNDAQRNHYRTDWHQYNLKRKVASLPPLSSETFAEKVLHAQATTRIERERATFERHCKACNKTYYSENAYANHVGSQKHRQNVATEQLNALRAGGSGQRIMAVGGAPPRQANQPKTLPLEACLFCSYLSPSLQLNVSHMTKAHGMFIPEAQYLVDLEGLIKYLGTKLLLGNQCLYCNKTKGGLEGIRTHMRDKGHTMLGFETEEQQVELGQFYDFRSSYSDYGEESYSSDEADQKIKSLKPKGPDDDEGWEDDGEVGEDDAGWETDSSASSLDSSELTSDGFHSHAHHVLYHDDYELHLPNGKSVGHRSLARYYRQNLRDHPLQERTVRAIADTKYPRDEDEDHDMEDGGVERREAAALSRRNQQGMIGLTVEKRREIGKMERQARATEERGRNRYQWGNEKRGNMQKHYRDPLLQ
ncbi:hypothetical protein EX30DRAFT_301034 [Ascodesmis nigricans]|uniref:C2H2-type domain-containing protein n=1 Tax=Ascodesmis nigricans TaxID=341454 RepID=A0A4S2N8X6_9PEZI|nr:hypothetical protein EX30DRAFT_301034 [Ascodesmis nigricans]